MATTLCVSTHHTLSRWMVALFLSFVVVSFAQPPPAVWDLVLLTEAAQNEGAVSIDGSPAAYYISRGAEANKVNSLC